MAKEPRSYFSIKERNEPSLDTWLPSTNFLQVGFRPGYSLQARELIEIQSIIQHQISTFAQEIGYLHGSIAKICEINPRYETFTVDGENSRAAILTINPGYIFMKDSDRMGYFVRYNHSLSSGEAYPQSLTWSVAPDDDQDNQTEVVFIGLQYQEQTITPEDDPDLYDNAAGFPNFNAPGAVRYRVNIDPDLVVKNVFVQTTPGDDDYSQKINNAVVNDFNGDFAGSNFIPLFYWSYPEGNDIKILHTNKAEYELQYEEDGETPRLLGGNEVYFKVVNPSNISLLESGIGNYEYCT